MRVFSHSDVNMDCGVNAQGRQFQGIGYIRLVGSNRWLPDTPLPETTKLLRPSLAINLV